MKSRSEHREFQRSYFKRAVDFFRQPLPEDIDKRTREIVRIADVGDSDKILDVGTGTGVLIQYFLEFGVPPQAITGCDLSKEMLDEAKLRYPSVTLVHADIDEFPTVNEPFDLAFFNGCFGNMYNPVSTLQRTSALMSSRGRIVISHPLGNNFLTGLSEREPELVLRLLPSLEELQQWCQSDIRAELELFHDTGDFYVAILAMKQRENAH